jgi:hypothetical protein
MDYEGFFKKRLEALHAEGRYRVFASGTAQQTLFPLAQSAPWLAGAMWPIGRDLDADQID